MFLFSGLEIYAKWGEPALNGLPDGAWVPLSLSGGAGLGLWEDQLLAEAGRGPFLPLPFLLVGIPPLLALPLGSQCCHFILRLSSGISRVAAQARWLGRDLAPLGSLRQPLQGF